VFYDWRNQNFGLDKISRVPDSDASDTERNFQYFNIRNGTTNLIPNYLPKWITANAMLHLQRSSGVVSEFYCPMNNACISKAGTRTTDTLPMDSPQ
jgi:hypothetical protein